jgi:hypothetical protein
MPPRSKTAAAATAAAGSTAAALIAASEDFLAAAARDQPEGMLQVVADAHAFPAVLDNIASAMKIRYDKAQDLPIRQVIKDVYEAVHKASLALRDEAADIGPLIEKFHAKPLARLRNPQPNEDMWDVRANQGT